RIAPDVWQAVGLALGRPMRMNLDRDANEEPEDAGHLAIPALLLRFGRGQRVLRQLRGCVETVRSCSVDRCELAARSRQTSFRPGGMELVRGHRRVGTVVHAQGG